LRWNGRCANQVFGTSAESFGRTGAFSASVSMICAAAHIVDALSVNVRRGMRQKIRRGEFPGKPPIGYLNEPRLRSIIVEPHKAKLVRSMFEAYATGRHTFDSLHELVTGWGLTSHKEKPIAEACCRSCLRIHSISVSSNLQARHTRAHMSPL